jgi:CheY-like chemotaxis protein
MRSWPGRRNTTSEHDWSPGGRSGITTLIGSPTTAFLADDDAGFREVARRLLTEDGYAVTEAADGGEALEMLSAMADAQLPLPEVLILEFVMPRLSGLGVLQALRRIGRLPPTLLLTRFLDPSVDTLAARFGVDRVLRKPIGGYALCAAVGETAART